MYDKYLEILEIVVIVALMEFHILNYKLQVLINSLALQVIDQYTTHEYASVRTLLQLCYPLIVTVAASLLR